MTQPSFSTTNLPAVIFSGGSEIVSLAIAETLLPLNVPLVIISLGKPSILRDVQPELLHYQAQWPPQDVETAVQEIIQFLQKINAGHPQPWPAFATEDGSLRLLLEARQTLQPYLAIPPGSLHLSLGGLHKAELFRFLQQTEVVRHIVPTYLLSSPEEAKEIAARLNYQVVFKPTIKPLSMNLGKLRGKKAIMMHHARDSAAVIQALSIAWSSVEGWIAQPKLTTPPIGEVVWWGIRDRCGRIIGMTAVGKWKYPRFGGTACWVQTAELPQIHQVATEILNVLDHRGIIEMEFLQDENGRWRLLELNPRLWLQAALPTRANAPLIQLLYKDLCQVKTQPTFSPAFGVSWVNIERMILAVVSGEYGSRITTLFSALNIIQKSKCKVIYDTKLKGVKRKWISRLLQQAMLTKRCRPQTD